MKLQSSIFWGILALVVGIVFTNTNSGIVYSQSKNPALEKAQNSLQAKFNSSSSATTPNPPVFQEIRGTSLVKGVWFTWFTISSDNELMINLRYVGDGAPPPLSINAIALAKNNEGKVVTMKGSAALPSEWSPPYTVTVSMNGDSSLYDSTSIIVLASAAGSPLPQLQLQPQAQPPQNTPAELENRRNLYHKEPGYEPPGFQPKPGQISPEIQPPGNEPEQISPVSTLKVLSSNSFIDSIGYFHVVGEIQNATPDLATFVQATATFYDKSNNVVGTAFSYTNPTDLSPGSKAPFEIILSSSSVPVKQIKHYRVTVSHD